MHGDRFQELPAEQHRSSTMLIFNTMGGVSYEASQDVTYLRMGQSALLPSGAAPR